ncbi:Cytochrome P450 [Musa troglodytarum]|uniref:Cytochrome P450 n=1 Tax=Musa troglodytarum TaxID=320322 RepID=A0A9E7II94_9LILI|nr:Cytochrome P450 [Musa troglodytarum]
MAIDPYLAAAAALCRPPAFPYPGPSRLPHHRRAAARRGQSARQPRPPRQTLRPHHVPPARLHGCVVASNADAARAFLKTHDAQFANRPDPLSARDVSYQRQDLVMADYNPTWKLLRKVCSLHMLGGKAFAGWAAVRRDESGRMIRSMHGLATKGEPVVLSDVLVCALANILGMVLVSRRVFDTHGEESNKFKNIVLDMLTGGAQFNIGDFFPSIAWMDLQGIQAKMRSVHVRFDAMLTKLLQEHEAPDFIDKLMENRVTEDGQTITDVNIKALISVSTTSAVPVEWAMAEMLRNPAILKRAQAEADAVVGRDRLLEESDLPKLAYLQAVCKEALRLHPSTPLSLPHFSYEECEVDSYRIPSNSRLLVNIWAIGRDPKVWADPLVFDPDRFVAGGEGAKYDPHGNDFEFIPFGAGRRICSGKLTGMVFVQYMLGALVHSFDWRLPDGEEELDMEEKHGLTISKAVPLKVLLTPRLSAAAYI